MAATATAAAAADDEDDVAADVGQKIQCQVPSNVLN
jgi:hypothetical protein